jgi:hypothetical protein
MSRLNLNGGGFPDSINKVTDLLARNFIAKSLLGEISPPRLMHFNKLKTYAR